LAQQHFQRWNTRLSLALAGALVAALALNLQLSRLTTLLLVAEHRHLLLKEWGRRLIF